MYVYYPDIVMHSPFRRYSLTILREEGTRESAEVLMKEWGIKELADQEALVVAFPNPKENGWDLEHLDEEIEHILVMKDAMGNPRQVEMKLNEQGIPDFAFMINQWHLMNDTRYYMGIGTGASVIYAFALARPEEIAGIACMGGNVSKELLDKAVAAPLPAWVEGAPKEFVDYLIREANEGEFLKKEEDRSWYANSDNPYQQVVVIQNSTGEQYSLPTSEQFAEIYQSFFRNIRRTNINQLGGIEPREHFEQESFIYYIEDSRLGDGSPHTWFVHMPKKVKEGVGLVPLMVFMHGGSDNPGEAADMSKFHEIGEEEGFITVYPWGTDTASWNCNLEENGKDDITYLNALLDYMIQEYPVDKSRIYLSGFSNGAGEAQVFAMLHPERIAGICHIDSNWPGNRVGPAVLKKGDVKAFELGLLKKQEYDYQMPVWYTYGTREPSYPVYEGCSQQHQYDFWKAYNHIEVRPTPPLSNPHPCGCGVEGDVREQLYPSKRHPKLCYDVQRFYNKEGENLYNYVMVRDKGHEVAQVDAKLGWDYVKQYRRNSDGSLGKV